MAAAGETDRVMGNLYRYVERTAKRVAFEVWSQIDLAMPVDTGRARANNIAAIGTPFRGAVGQPGGGPNSVPNDGGAGIDSGGRRQLPAPDRPVDHHLEQPALCPAAQQGLVKAGAGSLLRAGDRPRHRGG